jgi:protocatechuate 3,4-dioxygenase beta subunit
MATWVRTAANMHPGSAFLGVAAVTTIATRMTFSTTPSQTIGPYFAIGLPWDGGAQTVEPGTPGAITLTGEPAANAADPVLATVPEARRGTLLAQPTADGYRWDIRLQGTGETVFFAV